MPKVCNFRLATSSKSKLHVSHLRRGKNKYIYSHLAWKAGGSHLTGTSKYQHHHINCTMTNMRWSTIKSAPLGCKESLWILTPQQTQEAWQEKREAHPASREIKGFSSCSPVISEGAKTLDWNQIWNMHTLSIAWEKMQTSHWLGPHRILQPDDQEEGGGGV